MQIIKSVEISNFRSIVKLASPIEPNHLNIIVGQNDIGKSNFLKALNLFFNGETEIGIPFRFQDDFAKHAKVPNKKAPEITIKLEFLTPVHFKDNEPLIWTKVWRKEGLHDETLLTKSGNTPSTKGGGIQWVRKIKFKYVPAVRGVEYFNYLLGDLHDALSEIDPTAFTIVSSQFTKGLKKHVDELVKSISYQLGFKSQIGMPSNFRQLFATLDFSLDHNGIMISLNKKGDGIKAQHIPIILKFIANHYKSVSGRAVINPETIWGFEEPENNMEMGNAFKLAKIFALFSRDLQIFINTHSPAFYSLAKADPKRTNLYLVRDNNGTQLTQTPVDQIELFDAEMGILPIISDYVRKEVEKQQELEKQVDELSKLKANTKYLILSEDKDLSKVKILFEMQGYDMSICEFVSYESRSNLLAAIQSCKIKLTDKPQLTDIIFHRDRDIYNGDEPDVSLVKTRLDKLNLDSSSIRYHLFLTDGYDTESYFVNAQHIHELYPAISIEDIEKYIVEATKESEEDSINKLYERMGIMEKEFIQSGRPPYEFSKHRAIRTIHQLYESDTPRYRYGKKVYGLLIGKLQNGRGKINLLQTTSHIVIPQLRSIVNKTVKFTDESPETSKSDETGKVA